jgi:hypothetical protein
MSSSEVFPAALHDPRADEKPMEDALERGLTEAELKKRNTYPDTVNRIGCPDLTLLKP